MGARLGVRMRIEGDYEDECEGSGVGDKVTISADNFE